MEKQYREHENEEVLCLEDDDNLEEKNLPMYR